MGPTEWIDKGSFWLSNVPQGTERWHELRKGRLTMSNLGQAVGHSPWGTPEDLALEISGKKEKVFTVYAQNVITHGTTTEPTARAWYSKTRKVSVEEVGLAIPKWEQRLGASLDGDIVGSDGMIEIKCPLKMYKDLEKHILSAKNINFPLFYHDHIKSTHYDQMQGCMAITGKKWCDYIVFATESEKVFVDRVPFNEIYWKAELWPKIKYFLDNILLPMTPPSPLYPMEPEVDRSVHNS